MATLSSYQLLILSAQFIEDAKLGRPVLRRSLSSWERRVALLLRNRWYEWGIWAIIVGLCSLIATEIHEHESVRGGLDTHGVLLALLSVDVLLNLYARGTRHFFGGTRFNTVYACALLALCIIKLFFSRVLSLRAAFMRALLLICRRSKLRDNVSTTLRTIPETWHVWQVSLCVVLLYCGLGKLLFFGKYDFEVS